MKQFAMLLFFICNINCIAQVSFEEILTFEKKTFSEIENFLFKNGLSLNKSREDYNYYPFDEVDRPSDYFKDPCKKNYSFEDYFNPLFFDHEPTSIELSRLTKSNSFMIQRTSQSIFHKTTNTGQSSFVIQLRVEDQYDNANCKKDYNYEPKKIISSSVKVYLNASDFIKMKNNIVQNAKLIGYGKLDLDLEYNQVGTTYYGLTQKDGSVTLIFFNDQQGTVKYEFNRRSSIMESMSKSLN